MPDQPDRPVSSHLFAGIDIAAATATVAWPSPGLRASRPIAIDQTPQGFTALGRRGLASGHAAAEILVVMEATGACWLSLATALAEQGFAVSVINPAQAHHFAKALLERAKTDALDAQTLAQLAALPQPAPWTPPPASYEELQQRLAQRDPPTALRQQVRSQLHALVQRPVVSASVQARMEALIATLPAQIAELEAELAAALEQDGAWTAASKRLQSIPGVGMLAAAWLVVSTRTFTICATAEQVVAYAGLAPVPHQSGTSVRGRGGLGALATGDSAPRSTRRPERRAAQPGDSAVLRPAARRRQAAAGRALCRRPHVAAPGLGGRPVRATLRPGLYPAANTIAGRGLRSGGIPVKPRLPRASARAQRALPNRCPRGLTTNRAKACSPAAVAVQ